MEVLILLALILLNGLFAMSEIALVTARRVRLAQAVNEGTPGAAVALALHDEPTRFLSTVQIGITSIGILSGIYGESALAVPLAGWLQSMGIDQEPASVMATALVVAVVTYVAIVFGELVPKRIGQFNPEGIALAVARPMQGLSEVSRPFVRLLSLSTDGLLRLIGARAPTTAPVTEEDIQAMLTEGSEAGVIEHGEHQMLRNVFRLDERRAGSLMIPRFDVVFLDVSLPVEDNLKRIADSEHSRFPVCRGGLRDVLGIASTKQILNQMLRGQPPDLVAACQPAVFVPAGLKGMALLEHFRASQIQMVLVVNEFGEVEGLVTLQDVLEAVTGEFTPTNSEEAWAVRRDDGSWLLDGLIPIPELKDKLALKAAPDEHKARYHTLSGMLMWMMERIPQTGDATNWEHWKLEVVDMDGKRIDKVLATPIAPPEGRRDEGATGS